MAAGRPELEQLRARAKLAIKQTINDARERIQNVIDGQPLLRPPIIATRVQAAFEPFLQKLQEMLENIDVSRKIIIYLVGLSGCGKSSLINALVGSYVAELGFLVPGTSEAKEFDLEEINATFVDTRGIGEGEGLERDAGVAAEEALAQLVQRQPPDVILYCVTRPQWRNNGLKLVPYLKTLLDLTKKARGFAAPCLFVLNQIDQNCPIHGRPTQKQLMEIGMEDAKKISGAFEAQGIKFDSVLACRTTQYRLPEDPTQLDLQDAIGIDEIRDAVNVNSPLAAQLRRLNESMVDALKRSIASRLIWASTGACLLLAPLPMDGVLCSTVRDVMIDLLASILFTEEKNRDSFLRDRAAVLLATRTTSGIQTAIGLVLDLSAVATAGLGLLASVAFSAIAQPAMTAYLGWDAYSYFTGNESKLTSLFSYLASMANVFRPSPDVSALPDESMMN